MKKAILIGASSGIGRALAKVLVREGYAVGIAARRMPLLLELQKELGDRAQVKSMDVADVPQAMADLTDWLDELGAVDLVVLNAGRGHTNPDLRWDWEDEAIRVNVHGIAALGNVAMRYFIQRGAGHLVGVSSVAGVRGNSRPGSGGTVGRPPTVRRRRSCRPTSTACGIGRRVWDCPSR